MPDKANEWGWISWLDDWKRRGELAVTVALTALFTWLAAALPTEHQTHVDIWPPLGVAGGITAAAIYVLVAVEKGWWLPGKASAESKARMRAQWNTRARDIERRTGGTTESDALNRIASALERIVERLPEGDGPT